MILLPIGHEDMSVRRLPWVTFGIMAICVASLLGLYAGGSLDTGPAEEAYRQAIEYYLSHPYLQPGEQDKEAVQQALGRLPQETFQQFGLGAPEDPAQIEAEQGQLDALFQRARELVQAHPYMKWGLTPKTRGAASLFTHMFLHAGLLHLIGNLFMLYLVGPFIEDVWGRPLYALAYLLSGIAAAIGHVAKYPDSAVPVVGASGAIAGIMGVFLVRFWNRRIHFFYMWGLMVRGTFWAPAWLMLPLWLGQQVFFGLMLDGLGAEGGVAYWAHVFGFVFGVGAALLMKQLKVEEQYIEPAIRRKTTTTVEGQGLVDRAHALRGEGKLDEALDLLAGAAHGQPANAQLALAFWDLAFNTPRIAEAAPAMLRVVQRELRDGEAELAAQHWIELTGQVPCIGADAMLQVRIAEVLLRQGHADHAARALRGAMLAAGSAMPGALAVRISKIAREVDPPLARGAARLALTRPDLQQLERREAEEILALAAPLPGAR